MGPRAMKFKTNEKGCTLPFLGTFFLLLLLLLFLIPCMFESYSVARNKLMT
jgi:hypothetical protein